MYLCVSVCKVSVAIVVQSPPRSKVRKIEDFVPICHHSSSLCVEEVYTVIYSLKLKGGPSP